MDGAPPQPRSRGADAPRQHLAQQGGSAGEEGVWGEVRGGGGGGAARRAARGGPVALSSAASGETDGGSEGREFWNG